MGGIFVRGKGRIIIGDDVTINSCLDANPIGGGEKTIFYIKAGATLQIGNGVGISNSAIYSESTIKIGDNVLIGNGCRIYDSNFHSLDFLERRLHSEQVITKSIHIMEDAFIGADTIVLKGVTIGKRSIVAAGSVVVKSIPDDEVWGGNPARFIRRIGTTENEINN